MPEYDENFTSEDLYLINEYEKNGTDDFLLIGVGEDTFIVPYRYVKEAGKGNEAVACARFRDDLLWFTKSEEAKYAADALEPRTVIYDDERYMVPYNLRFEDIDAAVIARETAKVTKKRYNNVIKTHRELGAAGLAVGEVDFSSNSVRRYQKLMKQLQTDKQAKEAKKTALQKKASVSKMLTKMKSKLKKRAVVAAAGATALLGMVTLGSHDKEDADNKERIENVVSSLDDNNKMTVLSAEEQSRAEVHAAALKAAEKELADLDVLFPIRWDEWDDVMETFGRDWKERLSHGNVYVDFMGEMHMDHFGNLKKVSEMTEGITAVMMALEGMSEKTFPDGLGNPTNGIGMTIVIDENGDIRKVRSDDKTTVEEAVVQKMRYIEKFIIGSIGAVSRELSGPEILTMIGEGYCWGPTAFNKSSFYGTIRENKKLNDKTRAMSGFRKQLGLLKRSYLLAGLINDKITIDDILDMPVYFDTKNDAFLGSSIYRLAVSDVVECKKDHKGNIMRDKDGREMPVIGKDGFCTFKLDDIEKNMKRLKRDAKRSGKRYKTVRQLMPRKMVRSLQNNPHLALKKKKEIPGGQLLADNSRY